jgi:hypothetical protein
LLFAAGAIPVYRGWGLSPVLFQVIGCSCICGILSLLYRRQETVFHAGGIRAKRMFTTTEYEYGDIKSIMWGFLRMKGGFQSHIHFVAINFPYGAYVTAQMTDDLAAALSHALGRVEAEGRDTSGWLPIPDDLA